jgi:hypothetical protein
LANSLSALSQTTLSKAESSSQPLPEQQAFQQHLRALAQSAVRTVIEKEDPLAQCGSSPITRKCGCTYGKQGTWQQEQTDACKERHDDDESSDSPQHDPPVLIYEEELSSFNSPWVFTVKTLLESKRNRLVAFVTFTQVQY